MDYFLVLDKIKLKEEKHFNNESKIPQLLSIENKNTKEPEKNVEESCLKSEVFVY